MEREDGKGEGQTVSYNDKLRRHAQYYTKNLGLRAFPCKPKTKKPATEHGFKDATTDPDAVDFWWNGTYLYNIGIATGNGIVVLDVDAKHDIGKYGDETLAELEQEYGPLPDTWMCLTGGGGTHYYFACNDPALTVATDFLPGLDYRGDGGYVVAPPSLHESRREYEWEAAHRPGDVPLAPLPDWLHRLMLQGRERPTQAPRESTADKLHEGSRNDALFRLACSLRSKGMSEAGITAALLAENQDRCEPPLPDREVEKLCRSAGKYERGELPGGKAPEPPKEVQPLQIISAPDLQRAILPPVKFLIDGILPEGTSLLSAASKIGKSWMVLDAGLDIAAGEPFMGHKTNQCGVLYLALEDSYSRLQNRMNKILGRKAPPPQFYFTTKAPTLDTGLLETLDNHLKQHSDTKLIIIDTLQMIRGQALPREAAYAQDYREMRMVKEFLDSRGVSVIFIHHNRKMKDDGDPFNMISGTNGIMGAADTVWTITKERNSEEATLHITGRDVEQSRTVIRFDKGSWTWKAVGAADWLEEQRARLAYEESPIVKTIKKLLDQSPEHKWSGKMSDLLEAGRFIAQAYIAANETALGKAIKNLEKPLFDYDGIVHSSSSSNGGNGGKKHHFYYQDLSQFEDEAPPEQTFVDLPDDGSATPFDPARL